MKFGRKIAALFVRSDSRQPAEGHLVATLFYRGLTTIMMLAQGVLLTRLLGLEGRGLYAKLQTGLNLFILLLGFNLASALVYFIANRKIDPAKVVGVAVLAWIGGLGALGLVQVFIHRVPGLDFIFPSDYRQIFFAVYLFVSFSTISAQLFLAAIFGGDHRFRALNWLELVSTSSRVAAFAWMIGASSTYSIEQIFMVDVGLCALKLTLYLFYYLCFVRIWPDLRVSRTQVIGPIARFSALVHFSYLINFMYLRADVWLIEWKMGLANLGLYSLAFNIAQFLTLIPITLTSLLLPALSLANSEQRSRQLGLFARVNFTVLLVLAGIILTEGESLIRILYGETFVGATAALKWLTVSALFLSLKHLFVYYNVARERIRPNIVAELLGFTIGISCNLWLIPILGLPGAGIASLVASLTSFVYVLVSILNDSRMRLSDLWVVQRQDLRHLFSFTRP